MTKKITYLCWAILILFSASITAQPLGAIVDCEVSSKGLLFSARAKTCDATEQQSACNKHASNPKLGPSTPTGCKVISDIDELKKSAAEAIASQDNPKKKDIVAPTGPAGAPQKLPVTVTCKLNNPTAELSSIVTIANSCDQQQAACDRYKDVPFVGPAQATECQSYTTIDELRTYLKKEYETGRFLGMGGAAVVCKTRGEGKIYGVKAPSCNTDIQKTACQSDLNIADPTECTTYVTDKQVNDKIAEHPITSGLECQLTVGGTSYRVPTPDCSQAAKDELCRPKDGTVTSCKTIKPEEMKEWSKEFLNTALISCTGKDVPITYQTIGRDCSEQSKKLACSQFHVPTGCRILPIEELKKRQAEEAAKHT